MAITHLTSPEARYETAVRRYHEGRLSDAEALCRQVVAAVPRHAGAWHLLSLIAMVIDKPAEAAAFLAHATRVVPRSPIFLNTLGEINVALGKPDEALENFRKAVSCQQNFPEALNNLGRVYAARGDKPAAERMYRKALAFRPDYDQAWFNLGELQQAGGQWQDSIHSYRQSLAAQPDQPVAHFKVGCAHYHVGQKPAAVESFRQAVALKADFTDAHFNLGIALRDLGESDGACAHFQRVVAIQPDYAAVYNELGCLFMAFHRMEEAAEYLRKGLELNTDSPVVMNNLGNALAYSGKTGEAEALYRRALELDPGYSLPVNGLGHILKDQGRIHESLVYYRRATELNPDYYDARSNYLLTLHYDPEVEMAEIESAHRDWGRRVAQAFPVDDTPFVSNRDPGRPLRVGFVSADFRMHAVGFFLKDVFEALDPDQVQLFCYANNYKKDALSVRLQEVASGWVDIRSLTDAQVASRVRADEIDILVDLSGHTAESRLLVFARKPAPIQVSWLGYPDTTGLDAMDYRLTDAIADPEDVEEWHSEELVRLPEGFLCFGEPVESPDPSGPPCTRSDTITFGSFNNNAKISSEVLSLWVELLSRVPNSRLLVKNDALRDGSVRELWLNKFREYGVPESRLELIPRVAAYADHLDLYGQVDIALDVFPYNGTTTTCEALWMGVPVIGLRGKRHVGRVGASLLARVGLSDLVAETPAEYVDKAAELAADHARLTELRHALRERMRNSGLGDSALFSRTLEQAFREMWQRWLTESSTLKTVWISTAPRTGSMWLFNVTREILRVAGKQVLPDEIPKLDADMMVLATKEAWKDTDPERVWVLKVHSFLRQGLPHSRIITSRRDPRDVLLSFRRFMKTSFEPALEVASELVKYDEHYLDHEPGTVMQADFDDIALRPHALIAEIAEFLGVNLTERQVNGIVEKYSREKVASLVARISSSLEARIAAGESIDDGEIVQVDPDYYRAFDQQTGFQAGHVAPSGASDWRKELGPEEQEIVWERLGEWMSLHGYPQR